MKRLTVLLLAVAFAGLSCTRPDGSVGGEDYPRPLGLDWGMKKAKMVEIVSSRGRVASITPVIEGNEAELYRFQPVEFAGYKTRIARIGLIKGKLAFMSAEIPTGNYSIETWSRVVAETEKRFGTGKRVIEPFSSAEEKSAPKGTTMAMASWFFPRKELVMAISAEKGAPGEDFVIFVFGHEHRFELYEAAKAKAGGNGAGAKRKDF